MRKGFTLIELMIVIAIIAIIAAIAIPNLLESRISSNEAAAASSLKAGIHPAQVQFQAGTYADDDVLAAGAFYGDTSYGGTAPAGAAAPLDGNGIGDFAALFSQMSGSDAADGAAYVAGPTVVKVSFLPVSWNGVVADGGTTYSPQIGGVATSIGPTINSYVFVLGALNEANFVASCGPSQTNGSVGRRLFAVNGAGTVYTQGPFQDNTTNQLNVALPLVPFSADMNTPAAGWAVNRR